MVIVCDFFGCAVEVWGIQMVEVVGGVRYGFLFLYLCGGFIFYMHCLGCLVRRTLGRYLGIGCDMAIRKRISVLGLRRF